MIINLKFEDIENKMLERAEDGRNSIDNVSVSVNDTPDKIRKKLSKVSPRKSCDMNKFPDNSSCSSAGAPSCPRIYEEIIQGLEADIRKHIRIEHQLKLHIESVEDRIEELEREASKQPDILSKLE